MAEAVTYRRNTGDDSPRESGVEEPLDHRPEPDEDHDGIHQQMYANGTGERGTEYESEDADEAGLDDANADNDWDPNQKGVEDPDDAKGVKYAECTLELDKFLENKPLAYAIQTDGPKIEIVAMGYQGTAEEPGLANITSAMRDQLGYTTGRFDSDATDHHVDTILERVTHFEFRNDSMQTRYDRFIADLSEKREHTLRTPEELQHDLTKMNEFNEQIKATYAELREDIRAELLHGNAAAQQSFAAYQNKINDAAAYAAESRAKDYYEILGINASSSTSDVNQARRQMTHHLHPDHHPYPEYQTYMQGVNEAHALLRDPAQKEKYDELLRQNTMAHEAAQQATWNASSTKNGTGTGDPNPDPPGSTYDAGTGASNPGPTPGMSYTGTGGPNQGQTGAMFYTGTGASNQGATPGTSYSGNWSPEKVANWHHENEQKELGWLALLLIMLAQMTANATEKAGGPSADGLNYAISQLASPYGPDAQTQHRQSIKAYGEIDENVTARYAVSDDQQAEALRDLTKRASEHLEQYGLFDQKGNSVRNGQEPNYTTGPVTHYYEPIKGLEWDNTDHTIDKTMQDTMHDANAQSFANRKSMNELLKDRVTWIQGHDKYVDFNAAANITAGQNLLDQYNNNQVNRELREQAIEPVMLWNAENNLGAMVTFLDKSIANQRELTKDEIILLSDTIRHCDFMINATGKPNSAGQRP